MNGMRASGRTKHEYGVLLAAAWIIPGPKSLVPPVGALSAEMSPGKRIDRKSMRAPAAP
jgi:hypothetical protein